MPLWLAGAIVQKIERPHRSLFLLSLRLPGRSLSLALVATRPAGVLGAVDRDEVRAWLAPRAADAETMRWRATIEGARVLAVRGDAATGYRLALLRGGERTVAVVSRDAVALVAGDPSVVDGATDAPSTEVSDGLDESLEATLAAAARSAVERLAAEDFRANKVQLVAALERAQRRLLRRAEAVRADLAKIDGADRYIADGQLLLGAMHSIARGAREATLDDWSTGELRQRTLALDPSKTVQAQAQALFHRGKRLARGATQVLTRLEDTERRIDRLARIREELDAIDERGALAKMEARLVAEGIAAGKPAARGRRGADEPKRKPYVTYRIGERTVLVGRGAKDNDELTTKVARAWDLWLHAKGKAGAHVVVPLEKGKSAPPELLIDAAHLAAHFSDARGEAIVEVQWAERRHVRKPKGAAPGAVLVDREKVVVLRVDPERTQRLLAAAIEAG